MTVTASRVLDVLAANRYAHHDEDGLQAALASVLVAAGYEPRREVVLSPKDRIDLLVGRVGIEVKVAGTFISVAAQMIRYARSDQVDELVLVTTCPGHDMPDTIGGKPLRTLHLWGSWL